MNRAEAAVRKTLLVLFVDASRSPILTSEAGTFTLAPHETRKIEGFTTVPAAVVEKVTNVLVATR